MAVSNYSTNPDQNTTISGINIAEGCPPSGINNAIRQLMADVKAESDDVREDISTAQTAADEAKSAAEAAQSTAEAAQSTADQGVAASGVTAGNYGPTDNATPGYGAAFQVPFFTVDAKGRVTNAATKNVTLPAAPSVSDISGNAATASRLQTARTITIKTTTIGSGSKVRPATGQTASVSFDGSNNVTFTLPVRENYNCNCQCNGSWC